MPASPDPAFTVVELEGESDAFSAEGIRAALATARDGDAPLVVDLSRAVSVDSTVVGLLLESLADYESSERPLLFLLPEDAAPEVHRLFETTGLTGLLPLVRTWDEATARFAAHPA